MIRKEQVEKSVNAFLDGTDQFLLKVIVKPSNLVTVIIDGDHNISLEDCIKLSKKVEKDLILTGEDFELNVMSAGADKPFMVPRQYRKYAGRDVQVELADGTALMGLLISADDNGFEIQTSTKIKKEIILKNERFEYLQIKSARPVIKFK